MKCGGGASSRHPPGVLLVSPAETAAAAAAAWRMARVRQRLLHDMVLELNALEHVKALTFVGNTAVNVLVLLTSSLLWWRDSNGLSMIVLCTGLLELFSLSFIFIINDWILKEVTYS